MRRRLLLGFVALVAIGAAACAGPGLPIDELPEAPIAMLYWEPEAARRRAELIQETTAQETPKASRLGVASVDALGELLNRGAKDNLAAQLLRWPGHLALYEPRTGEIRRIEAAPPGARPLAWSTDHTRLLFTSARVTRRPQLFEYDLERRELRALTYGEEAHPRGDYGPEGRMVYTGVREVGNQIRWSVYLTRPGQESEHWPAGTFVDSPRWGPRDDAIVYVRMDPVARGTRRGGGPMLIARPLGADAAERILGPGRHPDFTPDGEWVVYSASVRRGWKLWRVRPDGTGRSPLGAGTGDESSPAVSPDGRFVVYVADEGGFDRLFVRRLDGSGDRLLLGDGSLAWPVW